MPFLLVTAETFVYVTIKSLDELRPEPPARYQSDGASEERLHLLLWGLCRCQERVHLVERHLDRLAGEVDRDER